MYGSFQFLAPDGAVIRAFSLSAIRRNNFDVPHSCRFQQLFDFKLPLKLRCRIAINFHLARIAHLRDDPQRIRPHFNKNGFIKNQGNVALL